MIKEVIEELAPYFLAIVGWALLFSVDWRIAVGVFIIRCADVAGVRLSYRQRMRDEE